MYICTHVIAKFARASYSDDWPAHFALSSNTRAHPVIGFLTQWYKRSGNSNWHIHASSTFFFFLWHKLLKTAHSRPSRTPFSPFVELGYVNWAFNYLLASKHLIPLVQDHPKGSRE
ncbi:hypothetical protein BCR44DRAFT_1123111 [Catenaria anguillulae PL171]|uniref:Uncharacterized protein n=1 Tax=Catenaria anguillulae PL171 TaxID=765915 RepID=A0A1Y2H6J8_9FUNG|nr:hypothetical protein BCR44DRAFT_1123111 [Catenaria anguillulae PL171]